MSFQSRYGSWGQQEDTDNFKRHRKDVSMLRECYLQTFCPSKQLVCTHSMHSLRQQGKTYTVRLCLFLSWQLSKAKPFCIPPLSLKLLVFVFFLKVIKDQIQKPGHLIPKIRNGRELWQKDSVWLALRLRPGFRKYERMVNEYISWKRRKDNSWTQDDPPVSWGYPSGCPLATGFFLLSALVVW